jgi:hypothetical protein
MIIEILLLEPQFIVDPALLAYQLHHLTHTELAALDIAADFGHASKTHLKDGFPLSLKFKERADLPYK